MTNPPIMVGKPLEDREKQLRRAKNLAYFTILYNLIEGVISIAFGIKEESISLAGFGGDSLIEVGSAGLVLWRIVGEKPELESPNVQKERRATLGIGTLFLTLSTIVTITSFLQLAGKSPPETTLPGVIISLLSLSFMFWLWKAKTTVATALDSKTIMSDARCSLACIKLSFVLFAGSILYQVWPALWWIDGVAAIVLAILIAKEGMEMVQAARKPNFTGGCCADD